MSVKKSVEPHQRAILRVIGFTTVVEVLAILSAFDLLNLTPVNLGSIVSTTPASGIWSSALTVTGYIIAIIVASTAVMVLRHKRRMIIWAFGAFTMIATFMVILIFTANYLGVYSLVPAIGGAGYVWWVIHSRKHSLVISVIISVGIGTLWAIAEPFYVVLMFPGALALYDLYAVFKGPLKTLVTDAHIPSAEVRRTQTEDEARKTYSFIDVSATRISGLYLGFGDTVIYAMMTVFAFVYFGILTAVVMVYALNIGVALTLTLLRKRGGALPALPISVLFGFIVLFIMWL